MFQVIINYSATRNQRREFIRCSHSHQKGDFLCKRHHSKRILWHCVNRGPRQLHESSWHPIKTRQSHPQRLIHQSHHNFDNDLIWTMIASPLSVALVLILTSCVEGFSVLPASCSSSQRTPLSQLNLYLDGKNGPVNPQKVSDTTKLGNLEVPSIGIGTISWSSDKCE